jgi:hypothetical protein
MIIGLFWSIKSKIYRIQTDYVKDFWQNSKYYIVFLLFWLLNLIYMINTLKSYAYIPNMDVYYYLIRGQELGYFKPDIFNYRYLGNYKILGLYSYLFVPFYSISPNTLELFAKYIIPTFNSFITWSFFYIILSKTLSNKKKAIFIVLVILCSYFLQTESFFAKHDRLSLFFFFIVINEIFFNNESNKLNEINSKIENKKQFWEILKNNNIFLIIYALFLIYLVHSPSFLLFSLTLIPQIIKRIMLFFSKNFNQINPFINYHNKNTLNFNKLITPIYSIAIFAIQIILFFCFPVPIVHNKPSMDYFLWKSTGLIPLLISLIVCLFIFRYTPFSQIRNKEFLYFLSIGTLIFFNSSWNFGIWLEIGLPYSYERYSSYLDFYLIFLIPIILNDFIIYMKSMYPNRICGINDSDSSNNGRNNQKKNNKKRILFGILLISIIGNMSINAVLDVRSKYHIPEIDRYIPDQFIEMVRWLNANTSNETVVVLPSPAGYDEIYHRYYGNFWLFDRFIVSYESTQYIMLNTLFDKNYYSYSEIDINYQNFLFWLYSNGSSYEPTNISIKTLELNHPMIKFNNNSRILNKTVNYILLSQRLCPDLYEFMIRDRTHFSTLKVYWTYDKLNFGQCKTNCNEEPHFFYDLMIFEVNSSSNPFLGV